MEQAISLTYSCFCGIIDIERKGECIISKIGYIRVSTAEQETARQEKLIQELGVDKIFMEKVSGKNTERPELRKMLEYLREGDTLYVESISRLSRSIRD